MKTFSILREGRPLLVTAIIVVAAVNFAISLPWAMSLWLLVAVLAFLLREPAREVPAEPLGIVSPVDGQVLAVGPCRDPFVDRPALRLRIRQRRRGPYGLYAPIEGRVERRWWPGREGVGELPAEAAGSFALHVRTDEHDDVLLAIDLRSPLHFLECAVQTGERVGQGRRIGVVATGVMVDVYLPEHARATVEPGEAVLAGSAIIGELVHK
ncbi:MAG: phosphatidylserine decarboxylase [Ectothiorhodospiraceae bacterium]|jgi:phosphatidylserine decarboxylase|nr:phosphatidylserine decarboxylase [Ectothiorhodospiraceae bacterium]